MTSVYDVNNKFLSSNLNHFVDLVLWPKIGNSSISMRKAIITSILYGFDQKNQFFEGCSWFKFNNLGLALGMTLEFDTSVTKESKLKVRKFWGSYGYRVTRKKLVGRPFWLPHPEQG